jgi:hypothetical protein
MLTLQEIFNRIQEHQREMRELTRIKKDLLESAGDYESLVEETKTLRARKKQMENGVEARMTEQAKKIELLKRAVADDKQLLADLALKNLLQGETVKVVGSREEEYEPLFTVRFRKKD